MHNLKKIFWTLFLVVQLTVFADCEQENKTRLLNPPKNVLEIGHLTEVSKLSKEQKEFAEMFLAIVCSGDYEKYKALFVSKDATYMKNQFWEDVQNNTVKKNSYWFTEIYPESMNFIYANPKTIYDVVFFKKINDAWRIVGSEIIYEEFESH
jgi:hypothetical protein